MEIIHRNGVDPKTKLPHPIQRLENAFEEAKIKIDERRSAEDQVKEILDKLRPVLPISFEKKEGIPHINYVRIFRATDNCISCHNPEGSATAFSANELIGAAIITRPVGKISRTGL